MPSHGCELSPSAAAFSTMLSAFVGSVLNGLFSGFWIAFFTGWISWLSVFRILAAGLYELYLALRAGTNHAAVAEKQYSSIGMNMYGRGLDMESRDTAYTGAGRDEEARAAQEIDAVQQHLIAQGNHRMAAQLNSEKKFWGGKYLARAFREPERTVTAFGWLGWIWSGVYTPISQTIWFAIHIRRDDGLVLFVRALAIGVSALGLTFDYKQRYGAALARKCGSWAFVAFNFWNAIACTLLGSEVLALLVKVAFTLDGVPVPLIVVYPIFAGIWAWGSWRMLSPIDGARPGINIVADILMGAFAGVFVTAPAFTMWRSETFSAHAAQSMNGFSSSFSSKTLSSSSGMELGEFLSCEGASLLEKFAAVMP